MQYTIYPSVPFDFKKMLKRPISRTSKLTYIDEQANSYACSIRILNRHIPILITSVGSVTAPRLEVLLPDEILPNERKHSLQIVRRILSTDTDINDFSNHFFADPFLKLWQPYLYGLRPILDVDLFQSMVRVMIGQQLNVKFAEELTNRLVMRSDESVCVHDRTLLVFPDPLQIANWSYEDLQALSFSRRKAEYVIDFARLVASGDLDLNEFFFQEDEKIIETLTRIRGIGRWTAECFLLFGLGRLDIMPAADIGVQNAISQVFCLGNRPRESEVRELSEKWIPWRSLAAYYFWNTLLIKERPGYMK